MSAEPIRATEFGKPPVPVAQARALVVSRDSAARREACMALQRAGVMECMEAETFSRETIARLGTDFDIAVVDADGTDGDGVVAMLADMTPATAARALLALTSSVSPVERKRLLGLGATEYVIKPYEPEELAHRAAAALHMRAFQVAAMGRSRALEEAVRARTRDAMLAQMETIERLAAAGEYRDDETGQHARRVGELSAAIGEIIGLPQQAISLLRRAAPLHDIGKIGVPDSILMKPGRLTVDEFEQMKLHTVIGGQILAGSSQDIMRVAEIIARSHHERWDGQGYPAGLSDHSIPLYGRIVAVADAYDALTHVRRYKPAWTVEAALEEIKAGSGSRYDPALVEAMMKLHEDNRLATAVGQ